MNTALKRQIQAMNEDELIEVLRTDYLRKINRYRLTDKFYHDKYDMDFPAFQKKNMVKKMRHSFDVETDSQEWELARDGIKTYERKLRELTRGT